METQQEASIGAGLGELGTAYGLYISLEGKSQDAIVKALMTPSCKTIEVAVKYQGEIKEFTFADFVKRLGFGPKKNKQGG